MLRIIMLLISVLLLSDEVFAQSQIQEIRYYFPKDVESSIRNTINGKSEKMTYFLELYQFMDKFGSPLDSFRITIYKIPYGVNMPLKITLSINKRITIIDSQRVPILFPADFFLVGVDLLSDVDKNKLPPEDRTLALGGFMGRFPTIIFNRKGIIFRD